MTITPFPCLYKNQIDYNKMGLIDLLKSFREEKPRVEFYRVKPGLVQVDVYRGNEKLTRYIQTVPLKRY